MKTITSKVGLAFALALLPASVSATTFNVRNAPYSATGNGTTDDRAAIQSAINDAIAAGPNNTVYIPAGSYYLNSSSLTDPNLNWITFIVPPAANGLIVKGAGTSTRLLSSGHREIFYLNGCSNCQFKSFVLDQKVLNLTQGTITAINGNAVTVTLDAGYPLPNASFLVSGSNKPNMSVLSDPNRKTSNWAEAPQISSVAKVRGSTWTFNLASTPNAADLNKKFYVWGNNGVGWLFNIQGCNNLTVQNVSVYEGGGFYTNQATGTLSFTNFYLGPPPSSNRLGIVSGMQGISRADLVMTGCSFLQSNDDAVNQLTPIPHILAKPAAATVQVSGGDYQPGDTVSVWDFTNPAGPYVRDTAHIVSTQADGSNLDIVLDKDVQIVKAGPQPEGAEAQMSDGIDRLGNLCGGAITLTNSTFVSSFARPLLIKSPKSITITGCNIYGGDQDGIEAGMETYWGEGPQCENVTIKNSTFSDMDGCSIDIGIFATKGPSQMSHDQTNFDIEGNTFQNGGQHSVWNDVMPRGIALRLGNVSGAIVKNNTFTNFANTNIEVYASDNVQITNNTFINPHQFAMPLNRSQGNADAGAVVWIDNSQNVTLSANVVQNPGSYETALAEATVNTSSIAGLTDGIQVAPAAAASRRKSSRKVKPSARRPLRAAAH